MTMFLKKNPRTAWRTFDEATLVITPDDKMIHELNETGTAIWHTTGEHGIGLDDLVNSLADDFDAGRERIEREVKEFVEEATRRGILLVEQTGD